MSLTLTVTDFGSWTLAHRFDRDGRQVSRPVRLIIIEYLDGVSLYMLYKEDPKNGLSAFHLEEEYRLDILAQAVDAKARLVRAGVRDIDFAPRNVIRLERPDSTKPRVVIIDFAQANLIHKIVKNRHNRDHVYTDGPPRNPIDLFWYGGFEEFGGWIPLEWSAKPRLSQEWLQERFGGKNASSYKQLEKENYEYYE
jgi:hypothetical protein